MATNYPTALDTLANPAASDKMNAVGLSHSALHDNHNDAIKALEAKLGIASSVAALGKLLVGSGAGASAWKALGTALQRLRVNAGATDIEWYDEPSARVYHNTTQSAANAGATNFLQFNSNRWLTGITQGNGNATNSKLIVPVAGKYLIVLNVSFPNNTTGAYRRIGLLLNNATNMGQITQYPTQGGTWLNDIAMAGVYSLAANEYVEAFCAHDASTSLTMPNFGNAYPEFTIARVG